MWGGDKVSLCVSLPGLWCAVRLQREEWRREWRGRTGWCCGLAMCPGGFILCQRGVPSPSKLALAIESRRGEREGGWGRQISQNSLFLPFLSPSWAFISRYNTAAAPWPLQHRWKTNLPNGLLRKRVKHKLRLIAFSLGCAAEAREAIIHLLYVPTTQAGKLKAYAAPSILTR